MDPSVKQKVNFVGNGAKSMRLSVDASLRKLRTSYIDILYVHWWDYETGVKEVMDALHSLVLAGKVLYLVRPVSASTTLSFTRRCAASLLSWLSRAPP